MVLKCAELDIITTEEPLFLDIYYDYKKIRQNLLDIIIFILYYIQIIYCKIYIMYNFMYKSLNIIWNWLSRF